MKNIKELTILALGLGLGSIIILITEYYWALTVEKKPAIIIVLNSFGEFWFEFILLHIILVFVSIVLIIKLRKYKPMKGVKKENGESNKFL